MPTPQLNTVAIIDAVNKILAGSPSDEVARTTGIALTTLLDATQTYHDAGIDALRNPASHNTWHQAHIEFTNWDNAVAVAAGEITPALNELRDEGIARRWWWIRKYPHWRLRVQREAAISAQTMSTRLRAVANCHTPDLIHRWQSTIYEPETIAFGGINGMDIAHEHFCADSQFILDYLADNQPLLGSRETTLLLCTAMLRTGAGLDRFETADVWQRVSRLRPPPDATMNDKIAALTNDVTILTGLDTNAIMDDDHPLNALSAWLTVFRNTGRQLSTATATGQLTRGLRETAAHLIIFHWNRLGLDAHQQALLANTAQRAAGL